MVPVIFNSRQIRHWRVLVKAAQARRRNTTRRATRSRRQSWYTRQAVRDSQLPPLDRHRQRRPESGVLLALRGHHAIGPRAPAAPEVTVAGHPEAGADRANRHVLASTGSAPVLYVPPSRKFVLSVKNTTAAISFERPAPSCAREPGLRLDGPAVRADVDHPPGYLLDRRAHPR